MMQSAGKASIIIANDFAVGLKPPETSLHMNRVANHLSAIM
jgi:hypothetical protein